MMWFGEFVGLPWRYAVEDSAWPSFLCGLFSVAMTGKRYAFEII